MVLVGALWPVALGKDAKIDNSLSWIDAIRKLEGGKFMPACLEAFMSPDHMQGNSYLMSDYADEVTNLCLKFAPNPDQGTCKRKSFDSLDTAFQKAFFRHATQHMAKKKLPMFALMSMGDAGYIVSDKTGIELKAMRNDLCVEVHTAFGEDFIGQIPHSNVPVPPPTKPIHVNVPATTPVNPKPEVAPLPIKTDLNIGEDELNTGKIQNEPVTSTQGEGNATLSIGAIIGISCAVALCIALFFYSEARRRDRVHKSHHACSNGKRRFGEDPVIKVSTFNTNRKTKSSSSLSTSSSRSSNAIFTPIEEIKGAINNADWDNVYKLASQLAENDDGLSLPSIGSFKGQSRSHLCVEDQERTKTLDELTAKADWTGLAVTAALYAGETSGSSHERFNTFEYGADQPSTRRDTMGIIGPSVIHLPSSRKQDIEEGQMSMEQMVGGLSAALNTSDWSQVNRFANLIKDEKGGTSIDMDSQALVLANPGFPSSSSSIMSTDTTDTELSKKQTIEKLMRAGKWKGVSIMANMYEMESKQSHSASSMQPLQHADRVQKNMVGFPRDP